MPENTHITEALDYYLDKNNPSHQALMLTGKWAAVKPILLQNISNLGWKRILLLMILIIIRLAMSVFTVSGLLKNCKSSFLFSFTREKVKHEILPLNLV